MTGSPESAVEPPKVAANPATTEPPKPAAKEDDDRLGMVLGLLFWVVIVSLGVFGYDTTREFIFRWGWVIALVAVIGLMIGLLVVLLPAGRRWLNNSRPNTRAALFTFAVVPSLLAIVLSVVVVSQEYQLTALRMVFFVVVCLLPGAMWYLFLVTRKASLFNEFLANLNRLGLLRQAVGEDQASRSRRVESYLQKFEAMYGDLPDVIHEDVLKNCFDHYSKADTTGATTLSTTTVPVMLSTILIALGWLITLPPFETVSTSGAVPWVRALQPMADPITLAFLGAYFFSLQMLFRRYVLNDLGGTAYVAVSMRIILAVIGIWILVAVNAGEVLLSKTYLLLAGFVLGVFPRVIWQIVESLFKRGARFVVPSMTSQLPLSDLDGLTVWHQARLEEEDIENIPNMANADLVELMLNTRIPPERIIDWTDQAILYTQLGPQGKGKGEDNARHKLRVHGIRTATSLLQASSEMQRQGNREWFDRILTDSKNSAMPTLEASLTTNSNLKLIQQWRGTSDTAPRRSIRVQTEPGQFGLLSTEGSATEVRPAAQFGAMTK